MDSPSRLPLISLVASLALAVAIAGCAGSSSSSSPDTGHGKLVAVAAENFWGSIATQLAGGKATVESVIVNPDTDPHSYQPSAQDARTIAGAKLAIVNGLGYDQWMPQALAASPLGGRVVLSVGDLLGLKVGDNPHQWYSPASVLKVVRAIVSDYGQLDPGDRSYFQRRERDFLSKGLKRYDELRREIRARYAGVPVGYSESIFRPLGEDLGLRLLTPYSFASAIAEGSDVTAQDKRTVDRQAEAGEIKVWVYNSQNVTPDVRRVTSIVKRHRIPIATVTETLTPAGDDFQQWQVAQLERLIAALREATGK